MSILADPPPPQKKKKNPCPFRQGDEHYVYYFEHNFYFYRREPNVSF